MPITGTSNPNQLQYLYCPAADKPVKHQPSPDLRYACCGKPVPSTLQNADAPPPDQHVQNIWCPIASTEQQHTATESQRFGCCGRLVPAILRIKTEAGNAGIKEEHGHSKKTTAVPPMVKNSKASFKRQSFGVPHDVEIICLDSDEEDSSDCVVTTRSTPAVITGSFKLFRPLKDIAQRQHVEAARRATFFTGRKNRFQLSKFRLHIPDICEHSGAAKNALTPTNNLQKESKLARQATVIAATPISETRHLQFWIGPASQRWSSFKLLGIHLPLPIFDEICF
jgi:hypothetical protein